MYDQILLPTDGSEGAEAALEHALGLAEQYGARLHVLFVVDTASISPDARAPMVLDRYEERGEEVVETVADTAAERGVQVQTAIEEGAPHQAILDYAGANDVDLVVMGTHGRTGLDRYLLGSVTEKVVRTADVPVLTVRLGAT